MATLVKYTTDENEVRILYEYLAEASVVFPKVNNKEGSQRTLLLLIINPTLHGLKNVAGDTGGGHYGHPLENDARGHFCGQIDL